MSLLPSQVLDLSNWYLTLPIGPARDATTVSSKALQSFEHKDYFHVNKAGDAVCFSSFSGGSTTKGSYNPRSELREMSGDKMALWSIKQGTHTMTFTGSTISLPTTRPSTVIGQIHRGTDDVIEIRCWIPKPSARPILDVFHDKINYGILTNNYKLGDKYIIKVVASNSQIKVYYNDMDTPKLTIPSEWDTCFFKAGSYIQCNPTLNKARPNETTESWIYALDVEHVNEQCLSNLSN